MSGDWRSVGDAPAQGFFHGIVEPEQFVVTTSGRCTLISPCPQGVRRGLESLQYKTKDAQCVSA